MKNTISIQHKEISYAYLSRFITQKSTNFLFSSLIKLMSRYTCESGMIDSYVGVLKSSVLTDIPGSAAPSPYATLCFDSNFLLMWQLRFGVCFEFVNVK